MLPRCWPWSRVSQPREDAAPTPGSPPAPRAIPVKSWDEVPDFDSWDELAAYWETHDASRLFGSGWRRLVLRIWAGFWYAVGFVWGLFSKRS
jgi:hypothetical protein